MTYMICLDDHRSFTGELKKRFPDNSRYDVKSFITSEEFIDHLRKQKENSSCKITIIGVSETTDDYRRTRKIVKEVKAIDQNTGIILLGPEDRMEALKKNVIGIIDAYIPKNSSAILRIHNITKRLISEYKINKYKIRRNISLYVLFVFLFLAAIIVLVAYFRFPHFF